MKTVIKKILIVLLIMLINFNFIFPSFVYCEDIEESPISPEEATDDTPVGAGTTTLDVAIIWLGNRFVEIMVNQGDNAKDYFSALLTTFRRAGEVRN